MCCQGLLDVWEILIGDWKPDEHRTELIDDDEWATARRDDVGAPDEQTSRTPGNRRADRRVAEAHSCRAQRRAIGLDGGLLRERGCVDLIRLRATHISLRRQRLIPQVVVAAGRRLRFIARERRSGLIEACLQRTWIDAEEHLPHLHHFPLAE